MSILEKLQQALEEATRRGAPVTAQFCRELIIEIGRLYEIEAMYEGLKK